MTDFGKESCPFGFPVGRASDTLKPPVQRCLVHARFIIHGQQGRELKFEIGRPDNFLPMWRLWRNCPPRQGGQLPPTWLAGAAGRSAPFRPLEWASGRPGALGKGKSELPRKASSL